MIPRALRSPLALALMLLATLLAAPLAGCVNTRSGDTLYRVQTSDLGEEKVIRRKLWHVGKALEDIRMRYGMEDLTVAVVVTDLGGLGQTTPALSGLANISGAKVILSKRLFLEDHPDLDMVLVGLLAHEMMHGVHYARMPKSDLIELGRRYNAMVHNPDGPQREWVRAYERLTDMLTVRMGYGEELTYQKRASEANLAANDPPQVWDFYLTEPEIRAMMADPALLKREIGAAIDILDLPSAKALRTTPILFDEQGDYIPLRRRKGGS